MPETETPPAAQAVAAVDAAKSAGSAAHTKAADDASALRGRFLRPIKITLLGAGSAFTPRLVRDFLMIEGTRGGTIALVDIDEDRLSAMHRIVEKMIDTFGATGWSVESSTDRREVMADSHYITNCIEVAGIDCVAFDNDIPLKYGVDQCIGDTIGPGGLFKTLRTVPVFLEVLRDARELCPNVIVLNYTNPMNMLCLAAGRAVPEIPVVGLCHSVQGTSHLLAKLADVPYEELDWQCAGINHLAWFTKLEHNGQNLYETKLYEQFRGGVEAGIAEADAGKARHDDADPTHGNQIETEYEHDELVRKDMCRHFGAFITESSGHLSEYLPYYRKSEAGRKLLRMGYHGGSRFYASNWPQWREMQNTERRRILAGEQEIDPKRSWEYASWIIEAREKNSPYKIYGNVMNTAPGADGWGRGELITNLPANGCVEVACLVDRNGVQPTRYGALPPQMASICASNMAMFDRAADACIHKSKEMAIQALMLDPLTAAVCTPGEIRAMGEEMFTAEADFLPGFE